MVYFLNCLSGSGGTSASVTGCSLMSHLSWAIAEGVRQTGRLSSLTGDLENYADAMVNAKSYGDFNGDGVRDAHDMQELQDHILNPGSIAETRRYDVNGDNKLDAKDITKWLELVGL